MSGMLKWLIGGIAVYYLFNKVTTATALMKINATVVGFRFLSLKSDYVTVQVEVYLENLSDKSLVLNDLAFDLYLNGQNVGNSQMEYGNYILEGHNAVSAKCEVRFKTKKLISLIKDYIDTKTGRYMLDVNLDGTVGVSGTHYDFTPSFQVYIPSLTSLVDELTTMINNRDSHSDIAESYEIEVPGEKDSE